MESARRATRGPGARAPRPSEANEPGWAHGVERLQRLAGNGAVARRLRQAVVQRDVAPSAATAGPTSAAAAVREGFRSLQADEVHATLKAAITGGLMASRNPSEWTSSSDFAWWQVGCTFVGQPSAVKDRDSNDLGIGGGVSKLDRAVAFQLTRVEADATTDRKTGTTTLHRHLTGATKGMGKAPIERPGLDGIRDAAEQAIRALAPDYVRNQAREETSRLLFTPWGIGIVDALAGIYRVAPRGVVDRGDAAAEEAKRLGRDVHEHGQQAFPDGGGVELLRAVFERFTHTASAVFSDRTAQLGDAKGAAAAVQNLGELWAGIGGWEPPAPSPAASQGGSASRTR